MVQGVALLYLLFNLDFIYVIVNLKFGWVILFLCKKGYSRQTAVLDDIYENNYDPHQP
jgi:hypothetical protein